MTIPRTTELAVAAVILWYVTGGFVAALDAITAATRRERLTAIGLSAGFAVLAVGITCALAWAAARARAGA